ncbi:MAG: hypothetical protein IZT59_08080 [Verrucomicrobia bacterium]|jgi:hypothetical protein|nr:hypothetical protein [Verrucomicrobiota bacterium]|tara:strand:+ start:26224 stop:27048 length:825 start_codon:yes stop_codon:yes gene_type:complete
MSEIEDEPWEISDEQKLRFAGLYLLEYMINRPQVFAVWLEKNDSDLEPILEYLMVQSWVEIREKKEYIPTQAGRGVIEKFMQRFAKFVYFFDIFSAVDLGSGEFAFAKYFDFTEEPDWKQFLADERWEDLRIAVAEYLDIDAVEIVFMSFIREDRFGKNAEGWQFDLLLGTVWDEILEICNEAIDISELGYQEAGETVSGDAVMGDILAQGATLLSELQADAKRVLEGKPLTLPNGQPVDRVVEPVAFPNASEFDFSSYIQPQGRDPFWEENWY